jgi:hypothetical protein
MSKHAQLAALLAGFQKTYTLPFNATVVSVEGETCTIKMDDLSIPNVRLKATANEGQNYLLITPKVNTDVLVVSLSGTYDNLAVMAADEIEKIEWQTAELKVVLNASTGKVSLQNNTTSLLDILQQLKNLLMELKVSTPSGISGTPLPPTIQALNNFETTFKTLIN